MNKSGQFYLIAAVFIVLILFGTNSIATYATVRPEPKTIVDVSDELNRETYNIVEYGVLNARNIEELGDQFAGKDVSQYFLKKSEDSNIVFVYGKKGEVRAVKVKNRNTGNIVIGNSNFETDNTFSIKNSMPKIVNGFVEVEVLGKSYKFEVKDNEMFYFLIVKERDDEVFVERNKEDKSREKDRPGGVERNK